ncbi:dihydroorotate dehydrogenase [Plectosphaerella plurivora]|uniref:Dihydroorotate dehydrogenase (fumarate) n=1 Tax=Plectosphaerella plurivora TaxID=936078 RepID=A0A9P8VH94_9PEZI|nr:dihydroorotate dehydrogenase [Plectosphaerella plurivora]
MEGHPPPELIISPPLLNSANPWATTLEHLQALHDSPHTGAVTTRTSLLKGFPHDDAIHQYRFFSPSTSVPSPEDDPAASSGSLNNLGYSPIPLSGYLNFIKTIHDALPSTPRHTPKPFIISVTGSPNDVLGCYQLIVAAQRNLPSTPLAMEINLSCPNIPNAPPPAYSASGLTSYLSLLPSPPAIPVGLKTPPFTTAPQFDTLIKALRDSSTVTTRTSLLRAPCRISFLTATNTLGSCLVLAPAGDGAAFENALPGLSGLGGMAGAPLHPLALGNVQTLSSMVAEHPELSHIKVIGVGGVGDADGFRRMKKVGASAVGVGTALGAQGVAVFETISEAFKDKP